MEQYAEVILEPVQWIVPSHGDMSRDAATREDLAVEHVACVSVLENDPTVDVTNPNTMIIGQ